MGHQRTGAGTIAPPRRRRLGIAALNATVQGAMAIAGVNTTVHDAMAVADVTEKRRDFKVYGRSCQPEFCPDVALHSNLEPILANPNAIRTRRGAVFRCQRVYSKHMKIDTTVLLPVAAVVASFLLLFAGRMRAFEIIALIASAAWLLVALGIVVWPLKGASHGFVIGGTLFVTGVAVYLKTSNKREVTASTALAILGGVLVVGALGHLG